MISTQLESKNLPAAINELLDPYKEIIGSSFIAYKNHVLRISYFTLALKRTIEPNDIEKISIAAVFHDIGMWTADTFDYLAPSIAEAMRYLKARDQMHWRDEISTIITMHHKMSKYKGSFAGNVEAFRKADLVDLSNGLFTFGLESTFLKSRYKEYPRFGFLGIILRRFFKNLIRHPLNPLPMFKR